MPNVVKMKVEMVELCRKWKKVKKRFENEARLYSTFKAVTTRRIGRNFVKMANGDVEIGEFSFQSKKSDIYMRVYGTLYLPQKSLFVSTERLFGQIVLFTSLFMCHLSYHGVIYQTNHFLKCILRSWRF